MKGLRRRLAVVAIAAAALTAGILALGGGPARSSTLHPLTVTIIHTSGSCTWAVHKSASLHGLAVASLTLAVNETATIDYLVSVSQTCTYDVSGTVSGDADHGGVPAGGVVVTVGGVKATVSGCASDGTTFTCNFDGTPTTASGTINATATYGDTSTSTGTGSYGPIVATEATVDVIDTFAGTLATHLGQSADFHYSRDVVFHTCGHFTVDNTATVRDGTDLASSSVSVAVTVPCVPVGCTLTPGYWKTHSKYGPAPSDPAWNLVTPNGPDTTFFLSGASWYTVINTPPSGGNAYYILSFQYIAAVLNQLNGATSTAAVDSALASAKSFFQTYTPAQIGALSGGNSLRQSAIGWATTLGNYNSGLIGPGHCDE